MGNLLIIKAKPNPAGKDRTGQILTPASQLVGEWIDIQNVINIPIKLDGLSLYHWAYEENGGGWKLVTYFYGTLNAGEVVRIHSGKPIPLLQMNSEDVMGANYHIFSDQNYVWNNNKEDFPSLWYEPEKKWIDQTSYDAFPPDGKILKRIQDKLL